jgi:hypothetical protein
MDRTRRLLMVTLNAPGNWPPELALTCALAQRGHTVRVLQAADLTPQITAAGELRLPPNVVAAPFVPHAAVLGQTCLVVTHAGHGTSWCMDETSLRVNGEWRYLDRAVDKHGHTIAFLLTEQRDEEAALSVLKKAIRRNGLPKTITIDGSAANAAAIKRDNKAYV